MLAYWTNGQQAIGLGTLYNDADNVGSTSQVHDASAAPELLSGAKLHSSGAAAVRWAFHWSLLEAR